MKMNLPFYGIARRATWVFAETNQIYNSQAIYINKSSRRVVKRYKLPVASDPPALSHKLPRYCGLRILAKLRNRKTLHLGYQSIYLSPHQWATSSIFVNISLYNSNTFHYWWHHRNNHFTTISAVSIITIIFSNK